MREAGANEALIDDMVSQLRKELEPDEPEHGDEDETTPRAQPFPMSAVPGWQEVLGCDGMRLFEEQDLEGTFKPEEIVLENISIQNFEGGCRLPFQTAPTINTTQTVVQSRGGHSAVREENCDNKQKRRRFKGTEAHHSYDLIIQSVVFLHLHNLRSQASPSPNVPE